MNKTVFLANLSSHLKVLNKEERMKFLSYYEEIIEDHIENGSSEEEAIAKIGDPQSIADHILQEQDTIAIQLPKFNSRPLYTTLMIVGFPLWGSVLLTILLFIFSGVLILGCGPLITGSIAVASFICSVVSIFGSFFLISQSTALYLIQLGIGILLLGCSVPCAMLTHFLVIKLISFTRNVKMKITSYFNGHNIGGKSYED